MKEKPASPSRRVRDKLGARSHALAERVKELECLHSIANLFEDRYADLGVLLQQVVELVPSAWQYPELACARITLRDKTFQTDNFRESAWRQHADITVEQEKVGVIEVGYTEPLANQKTPDFLREEQFLLRTVAKRLAEATALKEAESQLVTYEEHLRSLASELILAEERERRQLAIGLHDKIGQGLAVAKLKLDTLAHMLPKEYQGRVEDILILIKLIIADTRSITLDISPPILYELGFKEAVIWLGEHFKKQHGLGVEIRCDEHEIFLNQDVRVMLFRSIQELLVNVFKHAEASTVRILLASEGKNVNATVEDDGVGFDVSDQSRFPSATGGGFGLFSIRERIAHLGGRVTVDSSPGAGTRVHLRVPGSSYETSTSKKGG